MELFIVGIVTCVFVISATLLVLRANQSAQEGWDEVLEATRQLRVAQSIRISTLENRLLASNWQEFDALQRTPDEAAKEAFSEKSHAEAEAYSPAQEAFMNRLITEGEDLEGDNTDDYEPRGAILG